ncbi:MAG: asparaginase domain-containing protein [Acinetobacter populi]|jgi:L-asparaginase|uniref:asparaginase domain-containing protein n=1 Tax=Acinetobacter populi TaxID=1582270 RepID=UPI002352E147|nr:asparaginase domain-containing protein [Acinetobacter populi]MCH4247995.1 asparaginase domain-containing protein [Acinetobacter populi]
MNKIAIVYMGGTFGCVGSPLTPMPAPDFLEKLQQLYSSRTQQLDFFAAPVIKDSSELNASDWLELSFFIQKLRKQYQKFVLIHGTDTLHYAAAFLHHIFADSIHLIITGSQYPLLSQNGKNLYPNSDAWENLNFALNSISTLKAGVYLGFHHLLYHANSCYKIHTQELKAFSGLEISVHSASHSLKALQYLKPAHLQLAKNIRILNYYLSPDSADNIVLNLQAFTHNPPDILILQAFGCGNLPYTEKLKTLLNTLIQKQCWIILSSQVLYGELSHQYAAGSWLADLDLVFDPHHSQADLYARAVLLYLQYHQQQNWQTYWSI